MIIRIQVTRWHAQIGPLHNGGLSERDLRLSGTARFTGLEKEADCEITFIKPSEADVMFSAGKNINHEGHRWYGGWKLAKDNAGKLHLYVRFFLTGNLWDEMWQRSKTPPPYCVISFDDRNSFDVIGEGGLANSTENPLAEPVFSFVSA